MGYAALVDRYAASVAARPRIHFAVSLAVFLLLSALMVTKLSLIGTSSIFMRSVVHRLFSWRGS